jgi:hypothetical protein
MTALLVSEAFLINGCDEIPDGVVEQQIALYSVESVSAPLEFFYSAADSFLTASIKVDNSTPIKNVWLSVKSADGTVTVTSKSEMKDNGDKQKNGDEISGDNIFSAKVPMSKKHPSGKYNIEFFIEDKINPEPGSLSKVAVHTFRFSNAQTNAAPVISDLNIAASVQRGESFVFTIKASDPNGALDIQHVYFKLFRPDGSLVDPQNGLGYFPMVDNGDPNLGDQIAGDGVYSFKNSFGATAQTGSWKFEFQAKDKSGSLSNLIIHNMIVN